MSQDLPSKARAVIIGGGIAGCSVAYHLTKFGWSDVVLLERKQLTCGTTWHAAGGVGQLRTSFSLTKLGQISAELYPALEAETGQATGYRIVGSIGLATTAERFEELKRAASMAKVIGVEVEVLGPEEIKALWPIMDLASVLGAVHILKDGQTSPVDTTLALAKGAKARGARIFEGVEVTGIKRSRGRATGVETALGEVEAEVVVNCAGMWARHVGRLAGASVPLQACEHFYFVTEPDDRIPNGLPGVRDWDDQTYLNQMSPNALNFGCFESNAKAWAVDGIPEAFCFDELPEDLDHVMPYMEATLRRVPLLREVGIRKSFNGPESFTPDVQYLLGETPELRSFYVACGFNSIGIGSAGGAGYALAQWIVNGGPTMDLSDVDVARMQNFQSNRSYLAARAPESLGRLYEMHWPHRQPETGRGVRRSPFHDRLEALGACFGETAGWERPNWYAPPGVEPRYEYSYRRQNWFPHAAREHKAVREAAALFDLSSLGAFLVGGRDSESLLQAICTADVGVPVGKVVYTLWLNEAGGIEADLTVTRLSAEAYLVLTGAAVARRNLAWLRRRIPETAHCFVTDLSSGTAALGVAGSGSRALLSRVTSEDLSNEAFPFGWSKDLAIGYAPVRALRMSFSGELGWELHMDSEFALDVLDVVLREGESLGLTLAGMHAMDSCRLEKGFRHWGHDITGEDTPLEAGLGFACAFGKEAPFIGRNALLRQREAGPAKRLVQFALDDPEPLIYHHEPVFRNGELAGHITSGAYGHSLGRAVGLGYVRVPEGRVDAADFIESGAYEIEIAGQRFAAAASLRSLYDPDGERLRG